MFTKRYAILFFVLLFLLPARPAFAQDIVGDTIYTSVDQQTNLYFPENVTFCDYYDATAYLRFYKRVENSMVSLHAQVKNPAPALLKISEGTRNHLLILVYKEQLDAQELNHEWNDISTLKDYVNTSLARKGVQSNQNERLKTGSTAKNKDIKTGTTSQKSATTAGTDQYWKDKYAEIRGIVGNLPNVDTVVKERQLVSVRPLAKADPATKDNTTSDTTLKTKTVVNKDSTEAEAFKRKEALKLLNSDYANALAKAKTALKNKQYDSAKARFEEALLLKPGEQQPKEQLKLVNEKLAVLAQIKQQDDLYDSTISIAATALTQPPYENALQYFKDAHAMKPEEAYPVKMITYVRSLIADTKEKQQRADDLERKTQIVYLTGKANEALTEKRYDTAKILLNEVLQLNPTPVQEEYARKKVEAIEMELQRIALAIPVKKEPVPEVIPKNRREARIMAQRKAILAGASKEEARIKAVEEVNKLTAKQEEAKLKQAQDDELNLRKEQEAEAKQKADAKKAEDFNIARQDEIKRLAAEEKEAKLKAAQKEQDDLKLAKQEEEKRKTAQQEEAKLKAAQKEQDDLKLAKQEEEKRKTAQQEEARLKAVQKEQDDLKLAKQEEEKRKTAQQEEAKLKAAQKEQDDRKLAQQEQAKQKATATAAKLAFDSEKATHQKKIEDLMRKAYKEFNNKNYSSSRSLYSEVMSMNPEKNQEDFTRMQMEAIDAELNKATIANETKPTAVSINPAKEAMQPAANILMKQEGVGSSYTHQELLKKYPLINFDELPPGQTAETVDKDSRRVNFELSKTVLTEPARLNLNENNYDVKLTCQAITFSGSNACVKLMIDNKSEADFLTGTIQLTFIKNNGNLKQLNQRFISDFPVIRPGQQSQVIYIAAAPVNVAPDDVFIIEVNDRLKTTNLTLHIPGSVYKDEKNRIVTP